MKILPEYLPVFFDAVKSQILSDQKRWGQTWARRPRDGQEERVYARLRDYYDRWKNAGIPIPWLKIVGEAFIAWVRETQNFEMEKEDK